MTAATLFPLPKFRWFDANGDPLAGGKVQFYTAGTSTPKNTYTDSTAGSANTNPVTLDAQGYADIWGTGSYRIVVMDSSLAVIADVDNILVDGGIVVTNNNTVINGGGTIADGVNDMSIIAGGSGNAITGQGYAAILAGNGNTVSGSGAVALGGSSNTASGLQAIASGTSAVASLKYEEARAIGTFNLAGDAQVSRLQFKGTTANATPTEIFIDASSARLTIPTDCLYGFVIYVAARRTDADNESAFYKFEGAIDNNAGTTALVAAVTKTVVAEDTAAWDANVTADNTNDALVLTVTGEAAKTIYWLAAVDIVKIKG